MKRHALATCFASAALVAAGACESPPQAGTSAEVSARTEAEQAIAETGPADADPEEPGTDADVGPLTPGEHQPGDSPFGFPRRAEAGAEVGQWAVGIDPLRLAAAWEAVERGETPTRMGFTNYRVIEPGRYESKVKRHREAVVPNALIIPMPKGERAEEGQVVFTWWQTGGDLQRAIVVGAPGTRPQVRYVTLDPRLEDAKTAHRLLPDSFAVLGNELEPGIVVFWEDGEGPHMATVLQIGEDLVLVTTRGTIRTVPKDVKVIPAVPDVAPGARVWAGGPGEVAEGEVRRVDARRGQVWVAIGDEERRVSFGEVLPR